MHTQNYSDTSTANITCNESVFRALAGLGLLAAIVSGVITTALSIFVVATAAVYLVTTAIIKTDPVYLLLNATVGSTDNGQSGLLAS